MTQTEGTIEIVWPVDTSTKEVAWTGYAPRLTTLSGKRIGFLENGKINLDVMFPPIEDWLKQHGAAETIRVRKGSMALPMEPEHEVTLRECDAVVTAMGD